DGMSAESLVRSRQRCSRRHAPRKAHRAAALARMPNTAAALAAGRISAEHVDDLVRAADHTSPARVDDSRLVPTEGPARPADLAARDASDWVHAQRSADDRHQAHLRRRAARGLSIFVGDDEMMVLSGRFDPVTGAQIRSLVEAEADRLWRLDGGRGEADQVRTVTQRRADALHHLLCGRAPSRHTDTGADRGDEGAPGGAGGRHTASTRCRPSQLVHDRHQPTAMSLARPARLERCHSSTPTCW
ncbi:MAG: DUF222 domain-containing protein, partial [Acidimicrobiales bacterium]